MKAWLILEGEKKRRFDLEGAEATVGRGPGCAVRIDDDKISREHARIRHEGDRFVLVDLGSRNGTEVNGRRVSKKTLDWGDRIRIGGTGLVFITEEAPPEATVAPSSPALPAAGGETISIVLERPDLKPEDPRTWTGPASGSAEALAALYEIGRRLPESADAETLAESLLEILLRATPARRASLLLGAPPAPAASLGPRGRIPDPVAPDDPIVRDALRRNAPLLAHRTLSGRAFGAIAAPLPGSGSPQGVVYLDAEGSPATLDADHVPFVAAAANLAGTALLQVLDREALRRRNEQLEETLRGRIAIVGESAPVRRLHEQIRKAAGIESPVLVRGESGTGKELVARAIHSLSRRREALLLAVNCASIPEGLAESELFGHEKGAFTGADAARKGKFEAAHGGTLFLDEVGELPLQLQPKLLRVLEEKKVMRVGGVKEFPADVRLVAATHRDLEGMAREGRFRQDLLFRLRVIELKIPPLRERRADVPVLVRHFLALLASETGRRLEVGEDAMEALSRHAWPGNVRELKNALERAVVLAAGPSLSAADFAFLGPAAAPGAPDAPLPSLADVERAHVARILAATGWNRSRSAQILGIDRKTLYAKIKEYGLDPGAEPE